MDAAAAPLGWLGRQGTRAVALSVFAGIALPPVATLFKPAFTPALVVLLCLAFLRVEPAALHAYLRRPKLVIAATIWIMVATPLLFGIPLKLWGSQWLEPGLFVALMLQVSASPVISSPTFAALLRLDSALSLATMLVCTAVIPITGPIFAALFIGGTIELSPVVLGLRLAALLLGAAFAAFVIRSLVGKDRIERGNELIDGLSVIALFVFVLSLMDGATAALLARPLLMLGLMVLAFVLALIFGAVTYAVFARAGRSQALALAFSGGFRNMGLLLAAAGGFVPDMTWLYFAMAQFPIYLLPQILKPLARRLNNDPHGT